MRRTFPVVLLRGLLVLLPVAAAAVPAVAQPFGQQAATQDQSRERLRETIRGRFRVLAVTGGLVLVPRSGAGGVESIELRNGTVAINGTEVTGSELRSRLGRDADAVIELSYLGPEDRRRLLLDDRVEVPAPPSPSVLPPVPQPQRRRLPEVAGRTPDRDFRRHSEGRVRLGGDIRVEEDEEVGGPVVAIFGSVRVNGRVQDAVVAVGGGVTLGPRAEVRGDVTSVGGSVTRDASAAVEGQINSVEFDLPRVHIRPVDWGPFVVPGVWDGEGWRGFRLMGTLTRLALFTLLALALTLLLPGPVGRVADSVRFEPWKSALAGLFAQLLFIPLLIIGIVVLLISIVGIPLLVLVPFVVLAFFVALLLGFAGAASGFGSAVAGRSGRALPSALTMVVVGLAVIWGLTVMGRIVSLAGGPVMWAAALFLVVGFLVEYAAWTMGLGAVLLTGFGRNGRRWAAPPPIPPPPPAGPDVVSE